MANANDGAGAPVGILKWLVELIFNRDKDVGLYIAAGLVVLFAAIVAVQTGVPLDGVQAFAIFIGKAVVGAAVLIFIFHTLRGSLVVRIIANVFVVAFSLYVLAGMAQMMTGNRLTPPLATWGCMANPMKSGCDNSSSVSTASLSAEQADAVVEKEFIEPLVITNTTVTNGEAMSIVEAFVPPEGNLVIVHFSGAIQRSDVLAAAEQTLAAGWTMPEDDRGGERLASAAGLNEIRYFNAADELAAQELVKIYAESASWINAESFTIRDLSAAGFNPQSDHQFEIWTSVK